MAELNKLLLSICDIWSTYLLIGKALGPGCVVRISRFERCKNCLMKCHLRFAILLCQDYGY